MEKLLFFCGIWIIIVPILFQNGDFGKQRKYLISTQIIGLFVILMGILHFFNVVKKGNYIDIVLFWVLLIWVGKLSYDKMKNKNTRIIRVMCCISIVLGILSVFIVLQEVSEVASAIVILTCSLIGLSVSKKKIVE